MNEKTIASKKLVCKMAALFYGFYIFNMSFSSRIIPDNIATSLIMIFIFLIIIVGKIKTINKGQLPLILFIVITLFFFFRSNYYLINNELGKFAKFFSCIFLPFAISTNIEFAKDFYHIIRYFLYEHIIATYIIQFFPAIYKPIILPFVSNGQKIIAETNFDMGYNPGITAHYSTNGIYLSIATLYFFSSFLKNKKKKELILTIIALIALLFTAKRGHLVFTTLAILITYIYSVKERLPKRLIKGVFTIVIVGISFVILSSFIPSLAKVVERFEYYLATGNLLNGREELYNLAIEKWKEKPIIGNGWGSFSYFYHSELNYKGYGVDYMDAHNIYLQLLCETGIVGLLFYCIFFLYSLILSFKLIKKGNVSPIIIFAASFQLFFIFYGFTGNPLYDIYCYFVDFLCIGTVIYYKNRKVEWYE